MTEGGARTNRRRALWGIVLIVVGTLFLMDQLGIADVPRFRQWWPAIVIVIGLVRIVAPDRPRQVASGAAWVLLGLWLFGCNEEWYGLTYRNSWPLVLVIFGGEMVVAALLDRRNVGPDGKEEHHA